MSRFILMCSLLWVAASPALAADPTRPLKVTFQTTDCSGATGFASVDVDHIDRLQPITCDSGRALKQVLVKTRSGSFEVYTVAEAEAGKIEAQIQQVMESRRKALESEKSLRITH